MAQTSFPFENEDTTEAQYSDGFSRLQFSGVDGTPGTTDLQTYGDSTGMQVKVPAGFAIVRGHFYKSTAEETLTITAADATNPRIDLVVLHLDPTANTILLDVVDGTPAASPSAPALTQVEGGEWQMEIARITVAAGATTISAGAVADTRPYLGQQWGRWTTATRPASPKNGQAGWNSTTGNPEFYDGSSWTEFAPTSLDASVITSGEFGTARLADSAVTEAKLGTSAVTNTKIGSGAVTEAKIGSGAVTETKIGTGAVTEAKLATDSVTSAKIAAGAVGNSEVATGIDAVKLTGNADNLGRIRLSTTTDVTLSSTGHAFQIGADNDLNVVIDTNEIMARDNGAAGSLALQLNGGDVSMGSKSGDAGIGVDSGANKIWANGVYDNTLTTSYHSVYVSSTGDYDYLGYVASSIRAKKNIKPLGYTAEQILAIEPKEYNYKTEAAGTPKHPGMIAEDLHEAGLTGFVSYDKDGQPDSINYEFYVAALQQVVRHQATQIADLAARLDALEA